MFHGTLHALTPLARVAKMMRIARQILFQLMFIMISFEIE
jgi:hypothetical protein